MHTASVLFKLSSPVSCTLSCCLCSAVCPTRHCHHRLHPERVSVLRLSLPGPVQSQWAAVAHLQGNQFYTRQGNPITKSIDCTSLTFTSSAFMLHVFFFFFKLVQMDKNVTLESCRDMQLDCVHSNWYRLGRCLWQEIRAVCGLS